MDYFIFTIGITLINSNKFERPFEFNASLLIDNKFFANYNSVKDTFLGAYPITIDTFGICDLQLFADTDLHLKNIEIKIYI